MEDRATPRQVLASLTVAALTVTLLCSQDALIWARGLPDGPIGRIARPFTEGLHLSLERSGLTEPRRILGVLPQDTGMLSSFGRD